MSMNDDSAPISREMLDAALLAYGAWEAARPWIDFEASDASIEALASSLYRAMWLKSQPSARDVQ